MEESTTYQAIIRRGKAEGIAEGRVEGKLEGAREVVLRLGRRRFGEPDAATQTALASLHDIERLEQLAERLLEVESWQELLKGAGID
jgi:predicted transposase YdaD